jgi:WD40 repeat protein
MIIDVVVALMGTLFISTLVKLNWHLEFYLSSYLVPVMDLQDIVATGGIDTNAVIFDRSSGQILCTLAGHSKKVFPHVILNFSVSSIFPASCTIVSITQITTLKFIPRDQLFITGSADKAIPIYHTFK